MAGYGYQPPEDDAPADSWRETWEILKVVIAVLGPALGIIFGAIGLILTTLVLLLLQPLLALIPIALIVGGAALIIRRDRRIADEEEDRIFGSR